MEPTLIASLGVSCVELDFQAPFDELCCVIVGKLHPLSEL